MKRIALGAVAVLFLVGCSGTTVANDAQKAIAITVAVAQAEEPLVPVADQAGFNGFVNLAAGLDGQLGTCISNVSGLTGKNAKFLSCFNTFAQGLASPAELAQLRLLSPTTQSRAQLIIAAVIAGVNIAEQGLGGSNVTAPSVSPAPAVKSAASLPDAIQIYREALRAEAN